jgi:hypothetical protein
VGGLIQFAALEMDGGAPEQLAEIRGWHGGAV